MEGGKSTTHPTKNTLCFEIQFSWNEKSFILYILYHTFLDIIIGMSNYLKGSLNELSGLCDSPDRQNLISSIFCWTIWWQIPASTNKPLFIEYEHKTSFGDSNRSYRQSAQKVIKGNYVECSFWGQVYQFFGIVCILYNLVKNNLA